MRLGQKMSAASRAKMSAARAGQKRSPATRAKTSASKRRHGEAGWRGGLKRTTEYTAFSSAKNRCQNPNAARYPSWGGRGIEFRFADYEEFLACVGRRPGPGYSLDRIDNDGHYEPGNVRWATRSEQMRNRGVSRFKHDALRDEVTQLKARVAELELLLP